MSKKFKVLDYDLIYLSYDEPNAEKNYNDLIKKIPWAKRVHGVKGSDAAHKACANISETDRFITIDGDNVIRSEFLSKEFDFDENKDLEKCVISWTARNTINGLMYGNGGIKCWPKQYVLSMKTHENADPNNIHAQVDFCWDTEYIQMNSCYSDIVNNATPQQAWRAGFREGVKMSLDRGVKPTMEDFHRNHWKNLHRLYIWLSVGADVEYGLWAILGARQGLVKTMLTDWDYINVRDFEYLNNMWNTEVKNIAEPDDTGALYDACITLGKQINCEFNMPVPMIPLDDQQSALFKTVYQNPARTSSQQFIDRED